MVKGGKQSAEQIIYIFMLVLFLGDSEPYLDQFSRVNARPKEETL